MTGPDLASLQPSSLFTTMVYTLGLLSMINLLLGLFSDAKKRSGPVSSDTLRSEKEARSLEARPVLDAILNLGTHYDRDTDFDSDSDGDF